MYYFTLGIFLVTCNVTGAWQVLGGSVAKEKWVEPNAWAKEVEGLKPLDSGFCTCNAEGSTSDVSGNELAASFVLKKLVRQLFKREKLQYDEQFSLYQRSLLFAILPAQLEQLERLEDPRDLDSVLTEIFNNARTPNDYKNNRSGSWSRIFALIWDILKDCVLLLRFSEVRFISFVILIVIAGWFIHRKHKISIIVMILGGFFLFGYFHTYLECNRELEMKQMVEAIEHTERISEPYEPKWYSITSWFGSNKEEITKRDRHEKIKRESRLNLSFCRPDHVLIMYMNDIFMKQLEFLIEKCITTISSVKEKLGFPYNYMAVAGLLALLFSIIKLSFEHVLSPRVWTGYFHRSNETHAAGVSAQSALPSNNEDRISGENLKMLLQTISLSASSVVTNASAISGVQDVLEPLGALKAKGDDCDSSSSSNNTSASSQNLVSNSEVDLSENASSIGALIVEATSLKESGKKLDSPTDAGFVIVSNVKAKVLLEDVPNNHD